MSVELRAAEPADCERVYAWNFARDVRAVSSKSTAVDLAQHTTWFAARLGEPAFWIIEDDGEPVGNIRIDRTAPPFGSAARDGSLARESHAGAGRISIALDASARGKGIGRAAIRRACAAWGSAVIATIMPDNRASRAAFAACGFAPASSDATTFHWSP